MPPNTLQVILGKGCYGSKEPANSGKALKEDGVLRIRLKSHQVHPTMLQKCHILQYEKNHKIQTHKQGSEACDVYYCRLTSVNLPQFLMILLKLSFRRASGGAIWSPGLPLAPCPEHVLRRWIG